MVGLDCKHMTRENKLTVKDLLIAGVEGVVCLACTIGMLAIAWCFVGG